MGHPKSISNYLKDKTFDTIVNCAAYTAVDKAEVESVIADLVYHKAVEVLAGFAEEKNIK